MTQFFDETLISSWVKDYRACFDTALVYAEHCAEILEFYSSDEPFSASATSDAAGLELKIHAIRERDDNLLVVYVDASAVEAVLLREPKQQYRTVISFSFHYDLDAGVVQFIDDDSLSLPIAKGRTLELIS